MPSANLSATTAENELGAIIGMNIMTKIAAGKAIINHFMLKTTNNVKNFRGRI